MTKKDADFEFYLKTDLSKYEGQYVAIAGGRVIAHGDNASEVMNRASRLHPNLIPTLAKLPKDEIFIYLN
ncbi:MAG: DUF5678 domain-containing protein [Candidatus Micrarchaeota archaeon]